jgi:hypothetical protein
VIPRATGCKRPLHRGRFLGPCCSSAAAAGPAGRQKGPPLIARCLEFRRPVRPSLPIFAVPAPSLPWPFLPVPSLAPAASMPCRPWHGIGSFSSATFCPYILSRNVSSDSAGGETSTCRQRPFAGGSSWQRSSSLPGRSRVPKVPGAFRRDGNGRVARNAFCRGGSQGEPYWPAPEARLETTHLSQVTATKCMSPSSSSSLSQRKKATCQPVMVLKRAA